MAATKNLKKTHVKKSKKISRKNRTTHKSIKKILVPLDGSKNSFRALDMAISLSLHYSASITAISIFDLPVSLEYAALDPVGQDLTKKIHKIMNLAESRVSKHHIPFKQIIKRGKTGPDIISISRKGKFDIIVIGKRGISSIGELFVGSISHYVIHNSKIPVVVVK